METRELDVPGVVLVTPDLHPDPRGVFLEWFRGDRLAEAAGRRFQLAQANISVSTRGVVRGVHLAQVPQGQAKYVTAVQGRVLDVAVDLRLGSPAFGTWTSAELDDERRQALFLPEGIGHLFVVLSETATLCYLADEVYAPGREFTVSPLDPELALELPVPHEEVILSDRDRDAPTLAEVRERGLLPTWEDCLAHYEAAR